MKASFVTLLFMALSSQSVFAHGTNKMGPNNGYVRMPGAYHIELVQRASVIKIYFLDMTFQPTSNAEATVDVTLKGAKETKLVCNKKEDHFVCDNPEDLKNYKEIVVETTKDAKDYKATSRYPLPLKLQ